MQMSRRDGNKDWGHCNETGWLKSSGSLRPNINLIIKYYYEK